MMQNLGTVSADAVGGPVAMHKDTIVSFDVEWTGTLVATLRVQATNRDAWKGPGLGARDESVGSTDWQTVAAFTFTASPAGAAGRTIDTFSAVGYKYVRLLVDLGSSSGTVVYWAWTKQS